MSTYTKTYYPLMDILLDLYRTAMNDEAIVGDAINDMFEFKTKNGTIMIKSETKTDPKDHKMWVATLTKEINLGDLEEYCSLVVTEDTTSDNIRKWLREVKIL